MNDPQNDTRPAFSDVCHRAATGDPQIDTGAAAADVCRSLPPVERAIAVIAARQKGLITWRQLLAAGVSERSVKRRLRDGRLHRVFRGVYLVGHAVMPPLARELAAILAYEPYAVLSHRAGIGLWHFLPQPAEIPEVTVTGRNPGRQPGIRVHRARSLDPRDVTRIHDIPVTSPARTLLDFAEQADDRELERAWSEAQARNLISPKQISALLDRSPGRRGVPRLNDLLNRAQGPQLSRSDLEDLFLALIRQAHLPEPDMNVLVLGRYRVDFLWREHRLIAEADGGGWHASKQRRDSDNRRDSDLRAAGWKVERFTDHELSYEPHAAVARLTRALYAA
jgi:very-short-patch-repair endonuclease